MNIGDTGASAQSGREHDRHPLDPERIAAVRAALASGTYRIDAPVIAERLLDLEGLLLGPPLTQG